MNEQPIVSVLMTSYNRENYIAEAIESVQASSLQNYELIIVDDCSSDRTVDIAKSYAANDDRVKVYVNQRNLGDYHNRNKAASYAKGKYLKYLDSDDSIYPHGLEVMVKALEKFPEAGIAIQHNIREDKIPYPYLVKSKDVYREFFLGGTFPMAGPTGTIIKRDVFEEFGGFSGKRYIGDTELWLRIAAKYPVAKFQPALIWWRQHDGQEIVAENKSYAEGLSLRYQLSYDLLFSNTCPLFDVDKTLALQKLNRRTLINFVKLLREFKLKQAVILYNSLPISLNKLIQSAF